MKNLKLSISILVLVALTFAGFKAISTKLQHKWTNDVGFKIPESICYDKEREVLYVANMNGKANEKDGNGFISKIDLNGKTIKTEWVQGLNAPKGMGIIGNKLYVTDIDRIAEIDILTGKITKFYEFPEAKFLNDLAVFDNSTIYSSGSSTGLIFMIKDGKAQIAFDEKFYRPNGLFTEKENLYVGAYKGIFKVKVENGEREVVFNNEGMKDGIARFNDNGFIYSDWIGNVYTVDKDGKRENILDTSPEKINAADFEYIPEKNLIVIPTFLHNSVMAYELK